MQVKRCVAPANDGARGGSRTRIALRPRDFKFHAYVYKQLLIKHLDFTPFVVSSMRSTKPGAQDARSPTGTGLHGLLERAGR
jgi:hypothetical protein